MDNFEFKYIAETDQYNINGEMWRRAEPTVVKAVKKPYFPKPEMDQRYYRIDDCGILNSFRWGSNAFSGHQYHTLNCWLNKSEAEAYVARYGKYLPDRLTLAIRRWKIEHKVEDRFEWEDVDQTKYSIMYIFTRKQWTMRITDNARCPNTEYFDDTETLNRCLTNLQEYFDDQLNEWNTTEEK